MANKREARKRVVIVGAGPGGLASAMLLASAGVDVTVLEARGQVGGRTSIMEHQGYRFDRGPTFFLYPRVLREIFAMCGRDLDREVELIRLSTHYRLIFGAGGEMEASSDLARMRASIERLNPDDAAGLARYMEDNRTKLANFRGVLERPFDGWRDLLSLPWHKLLPLMRPGIGMDSDLRKFFADPRVRLAFTFQSKYIGMSPFQCPSLFTILSFLEYEYGVFHPRGGCGAVTEAMARAARELGATVRLDEPVTGIEFDGRRPRRVRTAQGEYACDAMVVNADFADAMRRLVPDALRRRWSDRKLERKRYSCSTYMLYLGLEGRDEHLAHHTIYLSADYQRNLADIGERHRLPEDPSFYVQNPVVTDPGMAPKGHSALYVLVPVSHRHPNIDWERDRHGFFGRVLDQLDKVGIADVRKRLRFVREVTPLEWERDIRLYKGATFSLAHNLGQMLLWRPHNRFEELDSVYLVGGGTHPGSGLPVIFESARISSRLLAEDLGIEAGWRIPRDTASLDAATVAGLAPEPEPQRS